MVATEAQIALGPKLLEILMLIIVVWTGVLGYSWRQGRDAMRDDPNINEGENYDSDTELSDIEQIKQLDYRYKEDVFLTLLITISIFLIHTFAVALFPPLLSLPGRIFDLPLVVLAGIIILSEVTYLISSTPVSVSDKPAILKTNLRVANWAMRFTLLYIVISTAWMIGDILNVVLPFLIIATPAIVVYLIIVCIKYFIIEGVFLFVFLHGGFFADLTTVHRLTPHIFRVDDHKRMNMAGYLIAIVAHQSESETIDDIGAEAMLRAEQSDWEDS
jgi:hypothetical protein